MSIDTRGLILVVNPPSATRRRLAVLAVEIYVPISLDVEGQITLDDATVVGSDGRISIEADIL